MLWDQPLVEPQQRLMCYVMCYANIIGAKRVFVCTYDDLYHSYSPDSPNYAAMPPERPEQQWYAAMVPKVTRSAGQFVCHLYQWCSAILSVGQGSVIGYYE